VGQRAGTEAVTSYTPFPSAIGMRTRSCHWVATLVQRLEQGLAIGPSVKGLLDA
jgi:hypothetical protein